MRIGPLREHPSRTLDKIRSRVVRIEREHEELVGFLNLSETTEDYREKLAGSERTSLPYLGTYHRLADLLRVGCISLRGHYRRFLKTHDRCPIRATRDSKYGLAAEAIGRRWHEAYQANNRAEGYRFRWPFLVLPLTFHQRTAISLASRTQPGALYKALSDDREIIVGLQARLQGMSERTFHALSIGFQRFNPIRPGPTTPLIPAKKSPPVTHPD